jgi:hypothetical protein
MKLRTVYLKVSDMEKSASLWQPVLESGPHRKSSRCTEFVLGEVRPGFIARKLRIT